MAARRVDPTKVHPMDLPELRNIVVSYLSSTPNRRPDILSCSCVSKAWLQTCLPYLWHTIDLRRFEGHQLHPRHEGIANNAHLIRHLGLEHMQFYELHPHLQDCVLPYCRALQRIELTETWKTMNEDGGAGRDADKDQLRLREWGDIAALVRQNPELQEFRIENTNVWTPPVTFWKSLAEDVPELRSFHIVRVTVGKGRTGNVGNNISNGNNGSTNSSTSWSSYNCESSEPEEDMILDLFLDICDRAEELCLDTVLFTRVKTERWINGPIFTRLQKLTYFGRSSMQFELFYKALDATSLRELTWGSPYRVTEQPTIIAPFLTAEIVKRKLALEALDLWEEMPFEDQELQSILLSLSRPLISLQVKDSEFDMQSLEAILQPQHSWARWDNSNGSTGGIMASHGSTLQTLNLQGCVMVTSAMVQRLLQNCPQLEVFVAWELKALDILVAQTNNQLQYGREEKQPTWVCRNLRHLEVFISVYSSGGEACRRGTTTAPEYRPTPIATTSTAVSFSSSAAARFGVSINGLESFASSPSSPSMSAPPPLPPGVSSFSEEERQLQRGIYREIAQLNGLEKLIIGKWRLAKEYFQNPAKEQGLDLRLGSGLDTLAGLTRLQELDFRYTPQNLGEEDIEWMAEHFCGTCEGVLLRGRFAEHDTEKHRVLEARFREVQHGRLSDAGEQ
ncbi:hypothetical protein BGZ96_007992 [Linnemannia gamsii]|uniref:F-box domain-containing protein n=1 Tax=Linnemannia gamsii TaxID=64522 RepID=A0ABQ7JZD9_9FUNG|nr:hypothetical protein BGZ96_007992 [Linnemannia gamsii]